ncbi:MAG: hypothetical protein QF464_16180, partial [Myxococcota bacterium]|nr:hypothetical protein [Myxococcota bacterium]
MRTSTLSSRLLMVLLLSAAMGCAPTVTGEDSGGGFPDVPVTDTGPDIVFLDGNIATDAPEYDANIGPDAVEGCASFPAPPEGTTPIYVSADCGQPTGDGSLESPVDTLAAALALATGDTAISVAAGTYTEAVTLPDGVALLGIGADLVILTVPTGMVGVTAAGSAVISGVHVQGATGAGVLVTGGEVSLSEMIISGTTAGEDPIAAPGHGIWATGFE